MAEKRVSVRLAVTGARKVREAFDGVGKAGKRGFGRLSAEMEAANRRLAGFARAARTASRVAAAAVVASGTAMIRSGLQTVDAQAKLAASLDTTVASVQVLARAAELSGAQVSQLEAGASRLTRRLSLFATDGGGPAAKAIERLGLNAAELLRLPLDRRIAEVTRAIRETADASEQAALFSQLFGDRAFVAFRRLDTSVLEQANADLRAFGAIVSDQDAAQIERTNDAVTRLSLVWRGLSNQLAVAAAPALEAVADAMAALARTTGPVGQAIQGVLGNLGRLASTAAAFAGVMAGRWVAGLAAAALSVRGLATALVVLRGALIRTGIGALIVGAGELIYQFGRLVKGAGGFGKAMELLGDVAADVWDGLGRTFDSFLDDFRAMGKDIEATWLGVMAFLSQKWAAFLQRIAPTFNELADTIGSSLRIDALDPELYGSFLESGARNAARIADRFRARAAETRAGAFDGVRESVQALSDAVAKAGADSETALGDAEDAAERFEEALNRAGDAAGRVGTGRAPGASPLPVPRGGAAAATAPAVATEAWRQASDALADYSRRAADLAGTVRQAFVGAFRGAERAVADFVRTGKADLRGLVSSMIADFARISTQRFILGPLASALSGGLGALFGGGARFPQTLAGADLSGLSYAGGGHTGFGARAGGLDGRGGFLAMLHPRERVIDETRRGAREERPVVVNVHVRDAESVRRSRVQIAADVQRAVAMGRRGV